MNGEERKFWEDFLEEADRVLDEKPLDENPPYDPPDSLREKYLRAVLEFDGQRYCQVKQLEQLFMF